MKTCSASIVVQTHIIESCKTNWNDNCCIAGVKSVLQPKFNSCYVHEKLIIKGVKAAIDKGWTSAFRR